jgi:hypothetical protein
MLEFFLSKLPLAIAGVLAAALITVSFGGIGTTISQRDAEDAVEGIAASIRQVVILDHTARIAMEMERILPPGSAVGIANGVAFLINGAGRVSVSIPSGMTFLDKGVVVSELNCHPNDVLILERAQIAGRLVSLAYLANV